MQAFYLGTRIFSGREGLKEAIGESKRIFLVTDCFLEQSGKSAYITETLEKEGKAWQIFSEVNPDPDTETISRGVCRLLEFRPDCICLLYTSHGRRQAGWYCNGPVPWLSHKGRRGKG